MTSFILNDRTISTAAPRGTTVLDFVRSEKTLKGTKIGCREGDCGACTVLVGELADGRVRYRSMTSCLMPLANAEGKHIVTVEGVNRTDGELTAVQRALVDESGTQCGFCTVGFVMSLTGFCLGETEKTPEGAVTAVDGNICRCTGYKSIERACASIATAVNGDTSLAAAIDRQIVPAYFSEIKSRLQELKGHRSDSRFPISEFRIPHFLGGGTDLYVQRPEEMAETEAESLFDREDFRYIREEAGVMEIGAATVVTDLIESESFAFCFSRLQEQLKLVSSTPIRNMATLGGNFINASPIGDMTIWFLALDAAVKLKAPDGITRSLPMRDLYLGYKQLAKREDELVSAVEFSTDFTHFNFEKVCKRTYLDIASVNTAISLKVTDGIIVNAHVAAGGVAPVPLYLRKTSESLRGKPFSGSTFTEAGETAQTDISPISDVRGSADYKRLLLKQLMLAHFIETNERA